MIKREEDLIDMLIEEKEHISTDGKIADLGFGDTPYGCYYAHANPDCKVEFIDNQVKTCNQLEKETILTGLRNTSVLNRDIIEWLKDHGENANESYTLILLSNILHLLNPSKVPEVLKRVYGLLKPGGTIFICVPQKGSHIHKVFKTTTTYMLNKAYSDCFSSPAGTKHFRFFTASSLEKLLSPYDFGYKVGPNSKCGLGNLPDIIDKKATIQFLGVKV